MKATFLVCLALVLGLILAGCETENVGTSHVSLANLNGDGRTETNMIGEYSGGIANGKTRAAFSLGSSSCWLLLYYPTNRMNQMSEWDTESGQATAWLVRTQLNDKMIQSAKTPTRLPFPDAEPLYGRIEAGNYDWRHSNSNHLAFDLSGTNGVILKAETDSHTKTKFDPKRIWLDPYLMIFGNFARW